MMKLSFQLTRYTRSAHTLIWSIKLEGSCTCPNNLIRLRDALRIVKALLVRSLGSRPGIGHPAGSAQFPDSVKVLQFRAGAHALSTNPQLRQFLCPALALQNVSEFLRFIRGVARKENHIGSEHVKHKLLIHCIV